MRVATVESALEQPTGKVNETNAGDIRSMMSVLNGAHASLEAALVIDEDGVKECLVGTSQDTYDVRCATRGQATGTLVVSTDAMSRSDGSLERVLLIQLQNVCANHSCATGEVSLQSMTTKANSAVLAVNVTITQNGQITALHFGAEADLTRYALTGDVVYFDNNGQSLLVENAVEIGEKGAFTAIGENGSFECIFEGDAGSCSGSSSFHF